MAADLLDRRPSQSQSKLVSIMAAGEMLGVGRSTIYRLISVGTLTNHHIGSRALLARADIERMLSE